MSQEYSETSTLGWKPCSVLRILECGLHFTHIPRGKFVAPRLSKLHIPEIESDTKTSLLWDQGESGRTGASLSSDRIGYQLNRGIMEQMEILKSVMPVDKSR